MLYLKIVLHNGTFNKPDNPIYMNIPVPSDLLVAIKNTGKITRAEFLFVEKGKEGKLLTPAIYNESNTELADYKINLG